MDLNALKILFVCLYNWLGCIDAFVMLLQGPPARAGSSSAAAGAPANACERLWAGSSSRRPGQQRAAGACGCAGRGAQHWQQRAKHKGRTLAGSATNLYINQGESVVVAAPGVDHEPAA